MTACNPRTLITRAGGGAALVAAAMAGATPLAAQRSSVIIRAFGHDTIHRDSGIVVRDSTVIVRMLSDPRGRTVLLDSIATLARRLDDEPLDSPAAEALRRQIDALLPPQATIVIRSKDLGQVPLPRGRIGFTPQGPSAQRVAPNGEFIRYFAYPTIISVDPESPAAKAGIEAGDLLVAYNGTDVRGQEFNMTELIVPEKTLAITVRRDGETRTVNVVPAKGPAAVMRFSDVPPEPRRLELRTMVRSSPGGALASGVVLPPNAPMLISPTGAFGATLSTVGLELSRTLKIDPGVLVNDAPEGTPAARAGLRPGDVIVEAAGKPIPSLRALQDLVRLSLGDQRLALRVTRDHKARSVTVAW